MTIRPSVLCIGLTLLVCSTVLQAHELAGGTHKHVWQPTAYGKDYRQGHSVDGPTGSIQIWSPATLNEYGNSNSVKFARPTPYTKQSTKQSTDQVRSQSKKSQSGTTQSHIPQIKSLAPSRYGLRKLRSSRRKIRRRIGLPICLLRKFRMRSPRLRKN